MTGGDDLETSDENRRSNFSLVSVIICTRGRNNTLPETVRSVLASDYPRFELLVIDQNDEPSTEVLAPFSQDSRLRHVHTTTIGKSKALNLAVAETRGEILALTDDDCEVPTNWLTVMSQALKNHPTAAIAYCNVVPGSHDPAAGFIPDYVRHGEKLIRSVWHKGGARGIGAGMAVRKDAVLKLGGFDTALGPGGPFFSADDWDLTNRALLNGYHVFETDHASVRHLGFRSHSESKEYSRRTWFSIGAAYSKPVKCGRWSFLTIIAYDLVTITAWPIILGTLRQRRPYGASRVQGFAQGFFKGLRTPVNKELLLFKPFEVSDS